ncbi:MAG TPA: HAMP domain-containing sensor histidine kinase, partial [Chryseolinea sp.]|nr:HAMP domain-containing sensor histidine kinase [Chryseolinea sp.]
ILEGLKNFKIESPDRVPISETKVAEFQMLNESVNSLIDRTVATFNSQKQFIENASHELQTPLAISINKLELLAERESVSGPELQEIGTIIQSLERLTRLNKTLLLLSRIENQQFTDRSTVNVSDLIDRVISDLSDLAEYKRVTVSHIHNVILTTEMNPELAAIMFANLLKNAIVHNNENGSVIVMVHAAGVTIENTGSSIALEAAQIFKRFYKSSISTSSTGLGLAIVKSIADNHGFAVQYNFNNKHVFSVTVC